MTTIFIDDISLLVEPVFLTVQDPQFVIITTYEALASARRFAAEVKGDAQINTFLDIAVQDATIKVVAVPASTADTAADWKSHFREVAETDLRLTALAKAYASDHPHEEVWLSLFGKAAAGVANRLGVRGASPYLVRNAIKTAMKHESLSLSIRDFRRRRTAARLLWLSVVIASLVVGFKALGTLRQAAFLVNPWLAGAGALVVGFGLFVFRGQSRMHYGLFEAAFGCMLAAMAFLPNGPGDVVTFSRLFQAMGGVYIIVRGLDNMAIGSRGTPYERWWEHFV